jgi:ribosome-associated protein
MSVSKPSKSARKREYLALQSLGERLIDLNTEQLESIRLDDQLLEAVRTAQGMRSHGALRRQKQLIGKLMRQVDPEPIRVALDALGRDDRLAKELFRDAEKWRDRIAEEGAAALAEFFAYTGTENPQLEQQSRAHDGTSDDKRRRLIRRSIFAEIHKDLAAKMQNEPR